MNVMIFDSEPATPAPRIRLLHTHRGHILGVRVPGKPYPVLPSAPMPGNIHTVVDCITRAIFEQTGLVVCVAEEGVYSDASGFLFGAAVVLGGALRPAAGFFHPSEFATSPDIDFIKDIIGLQDDLEPLKYEQVSLYPHEVSPGDLYLFPIVGTRYERTIDGDEGVSFCYENIAEGTLGRDDEHDDEEDADNRRPRKVVERDTRLGRVWYAPHKLNVRLIVHRLGGDFRGPST